MNQDDKDNLMALVFVLMVCSTITLCTYLLVTHW